MGCDIHLFVEVRTNGVWESADRWTDNPYYDPSDGDDQKLHVDYDDRIYTGRNYDLFAMLANVRNGRGFAGIKTSEGFVPICEPKGLPINVSAAVQCESDHWDGDGHSHSWHSLADLLAYDWDQVTTHQGWVDAANYMAWKYEGKPRSWSGGVDGDMVKHISHEEMEKALEWHTDHCYTQVTWQEPYRTSAGKFITETLPRLAELGTPDNVRIVFWFDN